MDLLSSFPAPLIDNELGEDTLRVAAKE